MSQTLLERENEHPQTVVEERGDCRVVIMDSARWVDERNTGHDVVVPASYIGVLPARMVAMHRPRGVIGHDACIGKEGAGIAGLWYLEALGIPAATADGMSAEMGNGRDLYESGVLSRLNYPAEMCGLRAGMSVREAAAVLLRRGSDRHRGGQQDPPRRSSRRTRAVVGRWSRTRSCGRTPRMSRPACSSPRATRAAAGPASCWRRTRGGSSVTTAACPRIGRASRAWRRPKSTASPGATIDGNSAPIGDAFRGYAEGTISACNEPAACPRGRGRHVGPRGCPSAAGRRGS